MNESISNGYQSTPSIRESKERQRQDDTKSLFLKLVFLHLLLNYLFGLYLSESIRQKCIDHSIMLLVYTAKWKFHIADHYL